MIVLIENKNIKNLTMKKRLCFVTVKVVNVITFAKNVKQNTEIVNALLNTYNLKMKHQYMIA